MKPSPDNHESTKRPQRHLGSGVTPAQFEFDRLHLIMLRQKRSSVLAAGFIQLMSSLRQWLTTILPNAVATRFNLFQNQHPPNCCA